MRNLAKNTHLTKKEIIKNGSIFTPNYIVDLVYRMVKNYIDENTVIADFCSGYGAFLNKFKNKGKRCMGTEIDKISFEFLNKNFKKTDLFLENSLLNVNRRKYKISKNDKLIIVGNPPYNDITSMYKKGEKGILTCDEDLTSRDIGISFLKAYAKLDAKCICVLHPLSYLIKKQNFKMLGIFSQKFRLIEGTIFSSKEFESIKKTNSDFPVVAALYKKDDNGMSFDYIRNFKFAIFRENSEFKLKSILTIDGIISKYPQKKVKTDLQFYTLRDMNSLIRNTSFMSGPKNNGVNITIDNLYQYSWLYFLKYNFKPKKNKFLYSNLSPLYFNKLENRKFKNLVVSYAYNNCETISKHINKKDIEKKYGSLTKLYDPLFEELKKLYILDK